MLLNSIVVILLIVLAGFFGWRMLDHGDDRKQMNRLIATQPDEPLAFHERMIQDLPEPARRFLGFAIVEGTPLYTVADIRMQGQFSLGTKQAPDYLTMSAHQILAAPQGFVWKCKAGRGLMRISGSDSTSWTRFWMAGIMPVARIGSNPDHTRSAFGRYMAEAVFWTPAALLPGPNVSWEALDVNTARAVIRHKDLEQAVDVSVAATGQPTQVCFQRWSNANPDKVYGEQPFGGYLSEYREIQGFRLPMHVEAGNFFGTDRYFPFFIVDVISMSFPRSDSFPG